MMGGVGDAARMIDRNELGLVTRIAKLYYERRLTQAEIAQRLDLSQASVSRLLKRAETAGIIRTTVRVPDGHHTDLEVALQERFDLKQAIVADAADDTDEEILRAIGAAAAFYLERAVRSGEVIGISSWSASLLAMVDQMHPVRGAAEVTVLQILGGVGSPGAEKHASHLTTRLASLLRGQPRFLPASGIVGSARSRAVLMEDAYVQEAVGLFSQVTLALVGIGAIEPSELIASSGNVFSNEELASLQAQGAVGDICVRFFDAAGRAIANPVDDRVIGMRLDQVRGVRRAVGIAGGRRKAAAIHGALRGRLINVLVTDRFTAEAVLGRADSEKGGMA